MIPRAIRWLPTRVDRRVRVAAWIALAVQILIVATGGAVRLTGSGLGCPTWPECREGSFVATPEMGIHGTIEFGNRLLFFVLQIVAVVAFLFIVRIRRERRDLFWLAIVPCFSVVLQAVLGGITVLTNLNPWVVGLHFLASVVLVTIATLFVYRVYAGPGRGTALRVPVAVARLSYLTAALVAVTVLVGIATTGSGPHAGDGGAARNGLDPAVLQHVHSWPAYATFALTAALVAASVLLRLTPLRRFAVALLAVEVVQIVVGVAQARLGLPEILVGLHMVLACVLVSAMTATVLALRARTTPTAEIVRDPDRVRQTA